MAKRKSEESGNVATMEKPAAGPINPHDSDIVPEVEPVVEGNEPLATETVESIFAEERTATEGAKADRIEFSRLYRQNNVRTVGEHSSEHLEEMLVSLRKRGYRPEYPITVSLKGKPIDGAGHDALVLKGNRRIIALEWLYANERETFDKIVPDGFVPAIIYTGLTEREEALIRLDHSKEEDRKPLTDFEEFLAVKQLVKVGFGSETAIAEKLGKFTGKGENQKPARSWAQTRVALARMPEFVQNEMQKALDGVTAGGVKPGFLSPLTWTHIRQQSFPIPPEVAPTKEGKVSGLDGAKNADMQNAAKGWINGEGPIFQYVWNLIHTPTDTDTPRDKALSPAEAVKVAGEVSSRNLREALTVVCKPGRTGLADIDGRMVLAEAAEATLAEIADFLGEAEFTALVDKAKQHAASKAAPAQS